MVIVLSTRARTIGDELDSYNHAYIALHETRYSLVRIILRNA